MAVLRMLRIRHMAALCMAGPLLQVQAELEARLFGIVGTMVERIVSLEYGAVTPTSHLTRQIQPTLVPRAADLRR